MDTTFSGKLLAFLIFSDWISIWKIIYFLQLNFHMDNYLFLTMEFPYGQLFNDGISIWTIIYFWRWNFHVGFSSILSKGMPSSFKGLRSAAAQREAAASQMGCRRSSKGVPSLFDWGNGQYDWGIWLIGKWSIWLRYLIEEMVKEIAQLI